ncbi:MAG: TIGR04013 family B12-binding domain/radical SAM domain-containing protein [Promethearchaeota archaeon]
MKKGLVLFGYDKPNRYSWAILMGFLDADPILRQHYTFHALNFHLYHAPDHQTELNAIPFHEYDVVVLAFSLLSVQMAHFSQFMRDQRDFFQKYHPHIVTVVGGPHAAAAPDELQQYGIDFVVPGEGERAFSALLLSLLNTPRQEIETQSIPGLARGYPNYIPATPPDLVEVGLYPPFSERHRFFGPIEISRGCPFRCKFCETGNQTHRMRHGTIENIVKWVKQAAEIKFDKVWFLSPNAFAFQSKNGVTPNPRALHELLFQITAIPKIKGIFFGTFPSEVRPESITFGALEAVTPFISNKKILIGAQSASNRLLKAIHRGHTFEDVRKAIALLAEFNLAVEIDFIFGLPGETVEDIQCNVDFFQEILDKRIQNIRIHTHTFMPLPGTPFAEESKGRVAPSIQKIIGKLAKQGKAYGEYQVQAGMVSNRYTK